MSKSYTLKEIQKNRIRIRPIRREQLFSEICELCRSCGELMFIDILACHRSVVYASFVNREDANAAIEKITRETSMSASFNLPNEESKTYDNEVFVLDISESKLNEWEQTRLLNLDKKFQYRAVNSYLGRSSQTTNKRHYLKDDPSIKTDAMKRIRNIRHKALRKRRDLVCKAVKHNHLKSEETSANTSTICDSEWNDLNTVNYKDWDFPDSDVTMDPIKSKTEEKDTKEEVDDDDIEVDIDYVHKPTLTSWSVFNGKPKDWSNFRLPKWKHWTECFPSLQLKSAITEKASLD